MLPQVQSRLIDHWLLCGPGFERSIINYLSLGLDARIALAFDRGRKLAPYLHISPEVNKLAYALHAIGTRPSPLSEQVHYGDQAVARWVCGMVWCNIRSYAGGMVLSKGNLADDGIMECHAFGPTSTLGLALGPLRQAKTLGKGNYHQFSLSQPTAMQIDGEPLVAEAGVYTIHHQGQVVFAVPGST